MGKNCKGVRSFKAQPRLRKQFPMTIIHVIKQNVLLRHNTQRYKEISLSQNLTNIYKGVVMKLRACGLHASCL